MYYLIHLKNGKIVKVSHWKEKEFRDNAFHFYKESPRKGEHWDDMQKFENNLEEFW